MSQCRVLRAYNEGQGGRLWLDDGVKTRMLTGRQTAPIDASGRRYSGSPVPLLRVRAR